MEKTTVKKRGNMVKKATLRKPVRFGKYLVDAGSWTLWSNLIAIVAGLVTAVQVPEVQAAFKDAAWFEKFSLVLLGVWNLILRFKTKSPLYQRLDD
jgi:uncharacterized membrane protein YhdT